jgi:hypothetical protein
MPIEGVLDRISQIPAPGRATLERRIIRAVDPGFHGPAGTRALLERAQGMLQKWPEGFVGFRARLRIDGAEGGAAAWIECRPGRAPVVDVPGGMARVAVARWLGETVEARTPHFFKDRDGRFVITRDPDEDPDAGVRLWVHRPDGRLGFWLDPRGRIRMIERIGHDLRSVSTIEEYARATPGRVLPARVSTRIWSAPDGRLMHAEVLIDTHVRVQHVWLPATRRIIADAGPGPPDALQVYLEAHELLRA